MTRGPKVSPHHRGRRKTHFLVRTSTIFSADVHDPKGSQKTLSREKIALILGALYWNALGIDCTITVTEPLPTSLVWELIMDYRYWLRNSRNMYSWFIMGFRVADFIFWNSLRWPLPLLIPTLVFLNLIRTHCVTIGISWGGGVARLQNEVGTKDLYFLSWSSWGAPKRPTTLPHFSKCSRPFMQSMKAPFLTLRVATPSGALRQALLDLVANFVTQNAPKQHFPKSMELLTPFSRTPFVNYDSTCRKRG